jgi:sigma-54 dependent transcriptional regulator
MSEVDPLDGSSGGSPARLLTLPATAVSRSVRAKAMVFEDDRSRRLHAQIARVAPSDATVLVIGETGTGKEIAARHLHELSARRERPFVAVNCGALPDSLVESELFGHERGAFTGALSPQAGWFEAAHGGTLLLDEIGELSPQVQVKLLRVLQEREVVRLGSRQPRRIDVRLVAATNVDLEEAVATGRFRQDLFYRLNVATLRIPPLRERTGDILPLTRYFLEMYRDRLGASGHARITAEAEQRLLAHAWPGNIRELENVIHHALLVSHAGVITPGDLRLTQLQPQASTSRPMPRGVEPDLLERALLQLFEEERPDLYEHIERAVFRTAYLHCHRNQLQTSRLLGLSRNIVRARLIQFGDLAGVLRRSESSRPPVSLAACSGG